MATPLAISIGTFDGVHRGHAALVAAARAAVGACGRVVAMVFDPHPLTLIRPESAPARLSSFAQRARWLTAMGVDEVVRLEPSRELLGQSPVEFLRHVTSRFAPSVLVEGPDFRFGRARAGDVRLAGMIGQDLGFATMVLEPVEAVLSDHSAVKCSSSLVRWLVERGRMMDATAVLGRPHTLEGDVVRGDQRGRTIGFPTANVQTDQLLPADGVYAALAELPDGRRLPAAVNVGQRPTFAGFDRRVEAHVMVGNGAELTVGEYGWPIRLAMMAFVRDQHKFESIDALKAQLVRDCSRVVELTGAVNGGAVRAAQECAV